MIIRDQQSAFRGQLSSRFAHFLLAGMLFSLTPALPAQQSKAWEKIPIPPLHQFKPQQPKRIALKNGIVIFLQEDHELPFVSGSVLIPGGSRDEDPAKCGLVDLYGQTSHFIWRDPTHILAWARHPSDGDRFYLYQDRSTKVEVIGRDVMTVNGHCTYLPNKRWILNDTYPDRERNQNPYLFNTETAKRYPLGHFNLPKDYAGEFRCDTHPRFSPDGKKVTIDSAHEGGRQIYLIDISGIAV